MPQDVNQGTFANVIDVTKHAQNAFLTAVNDLSQISGTLFIAHGDLITSALVADCGRQLGNAIDDWINNFHQISGTLQWMADQLGNTWFQIQQNEIHNVDLTKGLSVQTQPMFWTMKHYRRLAVQNG